MKSQDSDTIKNSITYGYVVKNCYWNTETSGIPTGDLNNISKGLTTAQMKAQGNFVGFDFVNVWYMDGGYPKLRNVAGQ